MKRWWASEGACTGAKRRARSTMPAHNLYTPKSRSQTKLDTNSSKKVNLPTSCHRKSHVKTMVFDRVAKLCKTNGSKLMCFSTDIRPGPSRTQAGASRPIRTTAPVHNTPQLFLALGSQVTRLRTRMHRCSEPEKGFRMKPFQNTYVFPSKVGLGTARRRERGDHDERTRWRTYISAAGACQR